MSFVVTGTWIECQKNDLVVWHEGCTKTKQLGKANTPLLDFPIAFTKFFGAYGDLHMQTTEKRYV